MKRYREMSDRVMAIFADFSPMVQQLSVDEAFLDISRMEQIFGPPEEHARKLKERIRGQTGLTVSAGLGSNKYVAKIASGMSKPDGLFVIPPGGEEAFMLSLPVSKIWGAGKKTQELFAKHGFKTCADIHRLSQGLLASLFGKSFGAFLYRAVRGEAAEDFENRQGSHSMSAERTFPYDLHDEFQLETELLGIASEVFFRMLHEGLQSRTVFIKIRYGDDFSTEGGRQTFARPVHSLNELYEALRGLFHKKYKTGRGIRLLGAGLAALEQQGSLVQADLFSSPGEKERKLEESILEINSRFPGAITLGRLMGKR
jgi:DNA polymerase-4